MFPALNKPIIALAALALILGSAVVLQAPRAEADLDPVQVWFLEEYGDTGDTTCGAGTDEQLTIVRFGEDTQVRSATAEDGDMVEIPSNGVLMCFQPEDTDGNVTIVSFDSTGDPEGDWQTPVCGTLDRDTNSCVDTSISVGNVVVPDGSNDLDLLAVFFDCSSVLPVTIRVIQDATTLEFTAYCGPPTGANLTIVPTTIESDPAAFNTAHSLIRVELTTSSGGAVLPNTEVDITVDRCSIGAGPTNQAERDALTDLFDNPPIEAFVALHALANTYPATGQSVSLEAFDVDTNDDGIPDHSEVLAVVHAEGCEPGPVTVTINVDRSSPLADLEAEGTITVIGPVAFITITAAPTELVCGEKAEITVSVTDALNQGVSDNTQIEVVTNFGGVLAGTGSSLFAGQPVNPLSSTTVEVFDGVGTAYLLTSVEHIGPYEVLAASTIGSIFGDALSDSPPVTSQVTVTCTLATAPDVIAPDTGTGEIRPPNTGDAGLAAGNGSATAWLPGIAGAALIALAAIAARRFAR